MTSLMASLTAAFLAAGTPCSAPGAGGVSLSAGSAAEGGAALALVLNLPAYRLDLLDGATFVHSYTVAIGSRRYKTPRGRFAVSRVELNPWWYPPPSRWARRDTVTPPGPRNPMGKAKLNFHELYFLHGTPHEESLGTAASHGCVRMASADAHDLARRVLEAARPDVPAAVIEAAAHDRRTRRYTLSTPVPLEIVYRTAEVRDGALELHPDVYARERTTLRTRALQALREAGIGEEAVDGERLADAVRAARREHVRVPLDELLLPAVREPPPAAGMVREPTV
ncbi:MAG TPA: L,D-transpeptidase [Longimicrobium sp.]|nr:L,D-transpeptidase [Longimicrobium sp.]